MAVVVPAQVTVLQVWEGRWRVIPYDVLPDWLKDNDYLLHGHRPPMPSFRACFKSIFRIHTETGNIWTHLLGDCGSSGAARRFHGAGAVWGGLWGAGWRAGQPHQALGLAPCSLCARNLWFKLTYPCLVLCTQAVRADNCIGWPQAVGGAWPGALRRVLACTGCSEAFRLCLGCCCCVVALPELCKRAVLLLGWRNVSWAKQCPKNLSPGTQDMSRFGLAERSQAGDCPGRTGRSVCKGGTPRTD